MAGKASIECEVCFEVYDDNLRIPKFLECFHTYCVPCLKVLLSDGHAIKCPACQKETYILEGEQVEKLQTNFYLTSSSTGKKTNKEHNKASMGQSNRDSPTDPKELKLAKLQAAMAARREMGEKLEVTLSSFQAFFQDLHEMRKTNRQKLKNIERYIEELKSEVNNKGSAEQDEKSANHKVKGKQNEIPFANLIAECEEAQGSYSLLTSAGRLSFTVNIDADPTNEELSAELFGEPIELGIAPDQASGQDGQSLAALSYLVLLNTNIGKKWRAGFLKDGVVMANKQSMEKPKRTVAEIINKSAAKPFDENRNLPPENCKNFNNASCTPPQKGKSDLVTTAPKRDKADQKDHLASESAKCRETNVKMESMPILPLSLPFKKLQCFLGFRVNGQSYGQVVVELHPELAPNMSRRFAQLCESKTENSYRGSTICKSEAGAYIIGGRTSGADELFMADASPLKRGRGAVFLRLKRDISKTHCTIVAGEFIIQLNDEKKDSRWTTTVFGYVCGGLNVCDKISRIDCSKSSVVISSAGIIK